jgi:transcriptional regulator with XRE-family HTH domain
MEKLLQTRVKTVATNIRRIREFKDYTQDYLAIKLGISQNAYSKIELGYTKITVERLFQIAEILETDPIGLLSLEQDKHLQLVNA